MSKFRQLLGFVECASLEKSDSKPNESTSKSEACVFDGDLNFRRRRGTKLLQGTNPLEGGYQQILATPSSDEKDLIEAISAQTTVKDNEHREHILTGRPWPSHPQAPAAAAAAAGVQVRADGLPNEGRVEGRKSPFVERLTADKCKQEAHVYKLLGSGDSSNRINAAEGTRPPSITSKVDVGEFLRFD
ncbi:hypothetical protein QBC33DRAFT_520013 [Phialemonium atrogriseum]|uniref:Uncharacterized protein n=1 Tax=Phialemonium atrogriseum TaxID=1093897 RepID=A0AAJ0BPW2_9PEZI|nr:uncharacterized protein QBC33DRAFT_520013 [Phialemonium atrogriseum]KAK1761897.1 hypothetical protein QBC33DRAFT_520013 [Phialemonium atrogriseum]